MTTARETARAIINTWIEYRKIEMDESVPLAKLASLEVAITEALEQRDRVIEVLRGALHPVSTCMNCGGCRDNAKEALAAAEKLRGEK
jgi:cytidine deaminase